MQLNSDQQIAAYKIRKFLSAPFSDKNVFTLTGRPGTGKTFMLRDIIKDNPKEVQAVTVSHAAKNILQESLGESVTCMTISKLLGLSPVITEDGSMKFTPAPKNRRVKRLIGLARVLIIDEVSQIDDDLYTMITDQAKAYKVKIIAVGDPYQLPPVEQNHDSKFFDHIDATLTIPMRFQGPIADIADVYRNQIDCITDESGFDQWALNTSTHRKDLFQGDTGYGFMNNLDTMIDAAVEDIRNNKSTTDFTRVLAFKNDSVAEINRRAREKLYGKGLNQFEDSEIVICNGGYSVTKTVNSYDSSGDATPSYSFNKPVIYNGQILKVKSYIPILGPDNIPCVLLHFAGKDFALGEAIFVVENTPEALRKYELIKSRRLQEAVRETDYKLKGLAWKRYYAFIDSFAYFDYAYSVNLYKAQGQTLNNVYVCEGEVMGIKPLTWKQKFQALYVAMTRAKEKLFIYNKEF